jgi:hypothetical protein
MSAISIISDIVLENAIDVGAAGPAVTRVDHARALIARLRATRMIMSN